MTRSGSREIVLLYIAGALATVVASLAVVRGSIVLLGAIGLVILVVLLWFMPLKWLLPAALTITLVVPTEVMPLPGIVHGAPLGAVFLAAWLVRAPASSRRLASVETLGWLLAAWLVFSALMAPLHTLHGLRWLVPALVAICGAAVMHRANPQAASIRRYFVNLLSVLAAYGIVEFLLHANPLYHPFFSQAPALDQHWSVYRIETLLGHPLVNGTLFAVANVLAVADLVERKIDRQTGLLRVCLLTVALALTWSRGAAIAFGIGLILVLWFAPRTGRIRAGHVLMVAFAALILAVLATALSARDQTLEGQRSAQARSQVISRTARLVRAAPLTGAGPGESEQFRQDHEPEQLQKTALENSYAELAVGLGVPGLLLFVSLLGAVIVVGVRSRSQVGEAAALVTLMVALAGYNAIEDHAGFLVLLGLLISMIVGAGEQVSRPASRPGTATRHASHRS